MLRAIIFDFNGVIVNDEPLHYEAFRTILAEENIPLTEEVYYARYLPLDDHALLRAVWRDVNRELTPEFLEALVHRKEACYRKAMRAGVGLFPGVAEFIARAAKLVPMAIASGAARVEIEYILQENRLQDHFLAIVAAEDVARGKPDPECFQKALAAINQSGRVRDGEVRGEETLVFEDSPGGIRAARAAGMRCVGITNSVPAERLKEAHRVIPTLHGVDPRTLEW